MNKTALTAAPILPIMAERWSSRSFESDYVVSQHDLLSILEAARWSPSANNAQPWRFSLVHRGTDLHSKVSAHLSGWNQSWAPHASTLIFVSGVYKQADGAENQFTNFDCGLTTAHILLQAQELGLLTHVMAGFDHDGIAKELELDTEKYRLLVAIALGKQAPADQLEGVLHERELSPRVRHTLEEIVLHNKP